MFIVSEMASDRSGSEAAAAASADLARNAVDVLPDGELERKIDCAAAQRRPLRIKLGIDPTAPDIHLGHVVVLQKLREFQDAGHVVVMIIGDFTARVGDPSGRSAARPVLSPEEIDRNGRTFQEQAFLVLDRERVEVRHNSEWLDMSMTEMMQLARRATVARILERDDFAQRMERGHSVTVLELLYPLLQAYDSVAVKADVELGGTDQKFNLLFGRAVQQSFGLDEQVVLTMPILPGTDGVRRMSKSTGNYIGISEPPHEQFGKVMSLPDAAIGLYYSLLFGEELAADSDPLESKRRLGRMIVTRFHGSAAAEAAQERFDRIHRRHEVPADVADFAARVSNDGMVHLPGVLSDCFGMSRSQARRDIDQGGVRIDGEPLSPGTYDVSGVRLDGAILQVGRRRFRRLLLDRA